MRHFVFIILLAVIAGGQKLSAQARDTIPVALDSVTYHADSLKKAKALRKKIYSIPRRAAIMSAVLPGLGQVYNRKYWKVPVLYAGLGVFAYVFVTNNNEFKYYRKNLIAVYDEDPGTVNTSGYSGDQLLVLKTQYRKTRDIGIIGMGLLYIFNVIDANVDGHLRTFDVSDDLSIHIDPWQSTYGSSAMGYTRATGLSIKINFN